MFKRLVHFLSPFLIFMGVSMSLPLFTALVYDEKSAARAFIISIAICFGSSFFIRLFFHTELKDENIRRRDSFLIVVFAWLVASLVGSFPFLLSGSIDNFPQAFFESCSGFTTTGASVFTDIEHLPHAILIWRCFSQWLGGMGIIVLFTALIPGLGIKGFAISSAETAGPTETRLTARYQDTARRLYLSYIFLTIVLFILLNICEMNTFDALAHAFATMATGGFSTHNEGLAYYGSHYIYLIIGIFAFLGGSNFALFFEILSSRIKKIFEDEEFRAYLIIIGISTILMTFALYKAKVHTLWTHAFSHAMFQTINTLSTTGYATGDANWPSFCVLLLVLLMICGGCSSSTAGGVKICRITIAFKIVRLELRKRSHEYLIDDIKYNGIKIPSTILSQIHTYSSLFFATIVLGTILLGIAGGGSAATNFITVISCISSLGPSMDALGIVCDYHINSALSLFICNFIMIAGRLEIVTLLVLFSRHFWQIDRSFN